VPQRPSLAGRRRYHPRARRSRPLASLPPNNSPSVCTTVLRWDQRRCARPAG
jgi:hypothetical protein